MGRCSTCKALGLNGDDHNMRTCPNGKNKGGRPVEHSYGALFGDLEPPPYDEPLKLNRWALKIVAIATWATMRGNGSVKLNGELVKLARMIVSLMPKDLMYDVSEKIKKDAEGGSAKKTHESIPMAPPVDGSKPIR
jgi:hypothetical protein